MSAPPANREADEPLPESADLPEPEHSGVQPDQRTGGEAIVLPPPKPQPRHELSNTLSGFRGRGVSATTVEPFLALALQSERERDELRAERQALIIKTEQLQSSLHNSERRCDVLQERLKTAGSASILESVLLSFGGMFIGPSISDFLTGHVPQAHSATAVSAIIGAVMLGIVVYLSYRRHKRNTE